jgi:uncharacterized cupredoxin-like copper-binding protein
LLAACGGGTKESPTPTAPPAPTVGNPLLGRTPSSAGANVVTIKAHELGNLVVFDVDRLAVPAGQVQFNFTNTGTMTHEVWAYPVQDIAKMMTLKRAGQTADETDYIKGVAGNAEDVEPGKSASFTGTLKPGFYELACFKQGKNPDGSTFVHFDRGQSMTLAATGAGGPSTDILTPSATISVDMAPGTEALKDSWLFVPDHLVAKAGDVTFKIVNKMDVAHDFIVYPLGDIGALIKGRLAGQEDYAAIKGQQLAEDLEQGKTLQKTVKLTAGWWAAACFVVSKLPDGTSYVHRDRGQRFTFLVT